MGLIREKLKKVKPNTITIIDLVLVGLLFLVMRTYFMKEKPIKKTIKKDGLEYIVNINKYEYTKDGFLILNLNIRNTTRDKLEIPIQTEKLINYVVTKDNQLIYKYDYLERKRENPKKLILLPRTSTTISSEWFWESNQVDVLEPGIYNIDIYGNDFGFQTKLKFRLLGEEKDE